jgi:hypothetical protein
LFLYHIYSVQELVPHDSPARREFNLWILRQLGEDPAFTAKVLFTENSCITMALVTNIHKGHVWSDENPHAIRSHQQQ